MLVWSKSSNRASSSRSAGWNSNGGIQLHHGSALRWPPLSPLRPTSPLADPNDAAGLADRKDIGTGDYVFQVLDSLPCVSPIRDAALGDATALSGEEGDQSKAGKAHGKELVCCAGHGDTGGSISVLQQSLELDALVSLDVPGATGDARPHADLGACHSAAARHLAGVDAVLPLPTGNRAPGKSFFVKHLF